jgi:hypothetical protein
MIRNTAPGYPLLEHRDVVDSFELALLIVTTTHPPSQIVTGCGIKFDTGHPYMAGLFLVWGV